ncbi:Com family DNA-binding transcriptional regulator [Acinetobacter junii]|uniref:Com family DNA-binding transcriptional regulator n=1 Tax=Acinetobacter junii TaxID=40215 RepID=UPI0009B688AF|nr:Com family DNA-binding transcriptional regulator [Acinetobacter junii]
MQLLKCQCCLKLLAKSKTFNQIEIKCPRCKTLNNFQSTKSALPECQEHLNTPGKIDESNHFCNTSIQS